MGRGNAFGGIPKHSGDVPAIYGVPFHFQEKAKELVSFSLWCFPFLMRLLPCFIHGVYGGRRKRITSKALPISC